MIVEMRKGATSEEVDGVLERAKSLGLGVQLNLGTDKDSGSSSKQLMLSSNLARAYCGPVPSNLEPHPLAFRGWQRLVWSCWRA